MGIKLKMSWIPARKGWMKNYEGKRYAVSCKQLGTAPTKEASWRAANEWWSAKETEIQKDAEAFTDPTVRRITNLVKPSGGMVLVEEAEVGFTADLVRRLLERLTNQSPLNLRDPQAVSQAVGSLVPVPAGFAAEALGIDGEADLNVRLDRMAVAQERTGAATNGVGLKVKEWLALLRSRTNQPKPHGMNIQRYDAYRREIEKFREWLPAGATISQLSGNLWEQWYLFLSDKLANGEWKATYCKQMLGTARQFLVWLSEDESLGYNLALHVAVTEIIIEPTSM